ncbi:META domain-containing protein [Candidatus Leptofilum sp.]|uniref:META domain-containing protein n=1 Tax=Candidatus Leptofilum sp. TaxID=3241576 RepID=UPI003B5B205D
MKTKSILFVLLTLLLGLVACNPGTVDETNSETETAVPTETPPESDTIDETAVPDELLGIWYWLAFEDSADGAESNDITVSDPTQYTLDFLADGTVNIKADCNNASSQATIDGSSLTFAPGPMTLAECEPGSLYNEFLAKLGDVVTYVFDDDGNLVLNLKLDAGNMILSREAQTADSTPALDAQSLRLDTTGVASSWNWVVVPEKPYDQSMPPGPVGLPAHIEILFGDTEAAGHQLGDPIMYLIPVEAYQQMWDEAGNTSVADALTLIADRTYIANTSGAVAALPFEEIMGVKDLTAQLGRAILSGQLHETSAAQSGYRFIGRWAQDANPVTNQNLTYVYQGFTNDGRYLVSFFYPITTTALLAIEDVSQEEFDRLANDYAAYMAEKTELLNGLDSSDFTPNLAALDALVASLEIDGVPVSGLQEKTWQWTSGPIQPGSSEIVMIDNPELYQVTYRADGTIEIVADCNQASMSYELRQSGLNGSLLATPGPMTLAECGSDSHYQAFISSLEAAQDYRVMPGGNEMELILPAGGGTLSFVAAP